MASERFDRLEDLPADIRKAIDKLERFDHLEIGQLGAKPAPRPAAAAPQEIRDRNACVHCGQLNEKDRELCWACFKFCRFKAKADQKPAQGQEIALVLDGTTYRSDDPALPEDIRELMDRIKKKGYSQELLVEWRNWRLTRRSQPPPPPAPLPTDVQVFRGQRTSVIRIDGKVFHSDDPNQPEELRRIFEYLGKNGVTPALMEYLRQFGNKVKYRPATTAVPSDGDVDFWRQVEAAHLPGKAPPPPAAAASRREAELLAEAELARAQHRFDQASNLVYRVLMAASVIFFYWLFHIRMSRIIP